jgi:hypothetical protein
MLEHAIDTGRGWSLLAIDAGTVLEAEKVLRSMCASLS